MARAISNLTGGYGCHLLEDTPERRTIADDFRKSAFGTDLAFQIRFLFRKPLPESFDFGGCPLIFQSQGELGGNLSQQS